MKILGKGLTRRGLLKRLAVAASIAPVIKLSETVARADKRRKRHRGASPDAFWLGHC